MNGRPPPARAEATPRRPHGTLPLALTTIAALTAWLVMVGAAWRWRSRGYAAFAAVVLGLPTVVGLALRPHLGLLGLAVPYLQLALAIHLCMVMTRPGARPPWFRAAISVPGLWFAACTFLALPWALLAAVGLPPWGAWVPFALGAVGLVQSLHTREETLDVVLDGEHVPHLARHPHGIATDASDRVDRPLRVVQISDPHIGPFMSVARLRKICQRAVEREPDLILVTGDIMTMESQNVALVTEALAPLATMPGRVFACHGNHDHEAPEVIAQAYEALGIRLLVDEATRVDTPSGPVEILGIDYRWRGRAEHLAGVCARWPRRGDGLRLALLHDPGAFVHLPEGAADLVFSGHTHGGQVGLVSLGLPHTFLSLVSSIPDHGLWARGRDRLYVHRTTGHYGFPIRLGVPAEQSLLRIHFTAGPT
jgi:uncharacterized protein